MSRSAMLAACVALGALPVVPYAGETTLTYTGDWGIRGACRDRAGRPQGPYPKSPKLKKKKRKAARLARRVNRRRGKR